MSINRRLYDCASIAGPYIDSGLSHDDANAHYGLVHSTLDDFLRLAHGIAGWQHMPMLSLIVTIIQRNQTDLTNRGAVQQWSQRKQAYDADCAAWSEARDSVGLDWRELPMTAPQRFLIADTAQILTIEVPEDMKRGQAADWLEANEANVLRRFMGENG
jgi:hypothetical protein